ncbi:MAG: beta-hexosaminidase [Clostridia bacterium]|nr:beta-hexosaminidase [Clostridia bacterium]
MKKIMALVLTVLTFAAQLQAFAKDMPFTDVRDTDWYYDAVQYVYDENLFNGTSMATFSPAANMTRAMFVMVLSNFVGPDLDGYTERHFLDVPMNSWYSRQVEWAAMNDIVSGTARFRFSPNSDVTREQMAVMLYRFAQRTGNDAYYDIDLLDGYADEGRISGWAREGMAWAVTHKVISGTSRTTLSPKACATRAQAAQIFKNCRDVLVSRDMLGTETEHELPDRIDEIMFDMSTEEKIGQMFLSRYPDDPGKYTKTYHPAGYTMYGKDFSGKTKDGVIQMIKDTQAKSKIPLFIAVDEEGGTVVRVSSNRNLASNPFESPRDVYGKSGMAGLVSDTETKSRLLKGLGINLNLAPVCDVADNPDDYIYDRTMGLDAEGTATAIDAIVRTMADNGMSGALKHFPGYGNNANTHTGIAIDDRPLSRFESCDLLPFQAGILADVPGVLVSHNIINCMDPTKPASLSEKVVGYLRNEMCFDGVIMTDDLDMDAIKLYTKGSSPSVQAVKAGNDLLLTSSLPTDYGNLLDAVKSGKISEKRIDESVRRILEWKLRFGIMS